MLQGGCEDSGAMRMSARRSSGDVIIDIFIILDYDSYFICCFCEGNIVGIFL